jgi:hypothetical protein
LRSLPLWCRQTSQVRWTSGIRTGTAGSYHNSQHSRVKGFHSSHPAYAVLPKEFGMWPQGSMWDYWPLLLYQDPKCELGLNLSPSIYASDWPKPRAANLRVISELEGSFVKKTFICIWGLGMEISMFC